jgi:protein-tyrosine phosphatase
MLTYKIKGPWPGELAIIPRPRGGDWLDDEIIRLRNEGFDTVVSLLTDEEIEELGLIREQDAIKRQGLQYCNYPIPDLGIPSSNNSVRELLTRIHRELQGGKKVGLHCRGSIGRSGLIAAGILVLAGVEPSHAIRDVTKARGLDSPETAEQREWVKAFSAELARLAA